MTQALATQAPSNASPASGAYRLLQRACACGTKTANVSGSCEECQRLQPKLRIGGANDRYEQEADRVAASVMRAPAEAGRVSESISRLVQRSEVAPAAGRARRPGPGARPGLSAPPIVDAVLASAGRPLAPTARRFFEARLGHDFARVRVHDDSTAAASAQAVSAHAYTVGEHVVFGRGRYEPESAEGRRLLAHELTHVVQQGGMLRRESISPPLHGDDERDPEPDDEVGVQRLQRAPAIVGLDEAGPKADLGGKTEDALYQCNKAKGPDPDECNPARPLTWADFSGPVSAGSRFAAVTQSSIETVSVPSQACEVAILGKASGPQQRFQGVFTPSGSWVKQKPADVANPAKNGSAAIATKCETDFDTAIANGVVNPNWALSTAVDPACPSSVRPAGTKAMSKAQCRTVIVADFTTRAIAESMRLLKHEQNHFSLSCELAKKANKLVAAGGDFAAIDAAIHAKRRAAEVKYDGDSDHGCNAGAQATWEAEIAAGLPSVALP